MIAKLFRGRVLLTIAFVVWVASGIFTVDRDEEGVVLLLGKPWKTHVAPGIHFAPPWPFAKSAVVRTTSAYQMSVGFKIAERVAGKTAPGADAEFLSGDTNILSLELVLQYVVDEPLRILYGIEDPHFLVRRAAESVATNVLSKTAVDDALTTGRSAILENIRRGTQEILRSYDSGIAIVSATVKKIEPPPEVIDAFQDVQNAKSDRERAINEANGYANEVIPRARGEAVAVIAKARGDREGRIEIARGEADRIARMMDEYHNAPVGVKERLYLETLERVLASAEVYAVDAGGRTQPMGLKLIR